MRPEIFADPVLLRLGLVPFTRSMASSLLVSALLVLFAFLGARAFARAPHSRAASASRLVYGLTRGLVEQVVGRPSPRLQVFAGALFAFIAGSAVVGQLPGIPSPTSNLAVTGALALVVFLAVPVAGIHARGLAYFSRYFRPNPLLFPLEVVSELSRTFALALRLFGNMMSGHLVVALLVALVGLVVPVPLMALDLLIGFLQAYIFTILACVYIGAGIRTGESE